MVRSVAVELDQRPEKEGSVLARACSLGWPINDKRKTRQLTSKSILT